MICQIVLITHKRQYLYPDDRIVAIVEIAGDMTERQLLRGISPSNAQQPLIPMGQFLPLGRVQRCHPWSSFVFFRSILPDQLYLCNTAKISVPGNGSLPVERDSGTVP
jgi:hypothetical protein